MESALDQCRDAADVQRSLELSYEKHPGAETLSELGEDSGGSTEEMCRALIGNVYSHGKVSHLPIKRHCYLDNTGFCLAITHKDGHDKLSIKLAKVQNITRTEHGMKIRYDKQQYDIRMDAAVADKWYKEVRAKRVEAVNIDEVERQKDPYWRAKLSSNKSTGKKTPAVGIFKKLAVPFS